MNDLFSEISVIAPASIARMGHTNTILKQSKNLGTGMGELAASRT